MTVFSTKSTTLHLLHLFWDKLFTEHKHAPNYAIRRPTKRETNKIIQILLFMIHKKCLMDQKHKKGFASHLHAIQYLTKLGYWVFDNISKLGPCDLIGLNDKGEILMVDVKSTSKRKSGTHAGYFIKRAPSKQQKELGIRILMVSEDGSCVFEKPQKLAIK